MRNGMARFGDTIELASRIALNRAGVDLQRDAVPILIGLPSTRVAALAAGSVDATIVVPPDNVLLKQKGFRELLSLGGEIPLQKIVDFRLLEEIRREMLK